jgi:hypothetical protein
LPKQLRLHGPLKIHSQFVFEGAIFNLKRVIHGTKGYLNQIATQINHEKEFISSIDSIKFYKKDLKQFTDKLCYKNSYQKSSDNILLPSYFRKDLHGENQKIFLDFFNISHFDNSI